MDTLQDMRLLRTEEVMELLNVSRGTIYNLRRAGRLRPVHLGRAVRYRAADVRRLIEESREKVPAISWK